MPVVCLGDALAATATKCSHKQTQKTIETQKQNTVNCISCKLLVELASRDSNTASSRASMSTLMRTEALLVKLLRGAVHWVMFWEKGIGGW